MMHSKSTSAGRGRRDAETAATGTRRITQGYPTYAEPDEDKGGGNGAPKPDGRKPHGQDGTPPASGAVWRQDT
jgi:hypothetical protein